MASANDDSPYFILVNALTITDDPAKLHWMNAIVQVRVEDESYMAVPVFTQPQLAHQYLQVAPPRHMVAAIERQAIKTRLRMLQEVASDLMVLRDASHQGVLPGNLMTVDEFVETVGE